MARKLTSLEATWSHAVLHDIFVAGGLTKSPGYVVGKRDKERRNSLKDNCPEQAKIICDEIKFRNFDFIKVDAAIKYITNYAVAFCQLHHLEIKYMTENQIAHIIAAFCAEQQIFWDDVNTHRTTVEMETYGKTIFGKACLDFKCFLSQQSSEKSKGSRARTGGSSAPKSGYKSSGPKSGVIKGLIGEPGEKIIVTKTLFDIVCDSTKKKKQYVFIDPLSPIAEVNKVRFGDPSGWSSCKVFFDSLDAAEAAIAEIRGSWKIPADITGLHIERAKPDPNGYFRVNTELGEVLIKASKLNEAMEEALTEEATTTTTKRTSRFPEINDIDVYHEAMYNFE